MIDKPRYAGRAVAEKAADPVDPDDPAGFGACADQVVGNVTIMREDRRRVGVRENDGGARLLHHLHRGAVPSVRTAGNHADPSHFGEDALAVIRKAPIGLLGAARSGTVGGIIGDQHPANTGLAPRLNKGVAAFVERGHALDIEENGELALGPCGLDISNRPH